MPKPASGQVVVKETAAGRVFALRFRAYGQRRYVTLGTAEDGWDLARARTELENVLADVRRGIWHAPAPATAEVGPIDPTFHVFASQWLAEIAPTLRPSTVLDYRWQLSNHLLPFFHAHRLSQISVAEVDRYRATKVSEGVLSPSSINKTLTRLGQILDVADERELIVRNPMSVNRRRRKLKAPAPSRSYLDQADQIAALLEAAGQLDREARRDRGTPRRVILATLAFAGLRIGELLALRWGDVDLAAGRLRVGASKTDAGIREVELLLALRDELASLRAASAPESDELVFGTTSGQQQNASNVRNRALAMSVERANELLAARGAGPLPAHLTPHSLRRTYASLMFALGRPAPVVMEQLGHTDARLTLRVYARAMRQSPEERDSLKALVEGLIGHQWALEPQSAPRARGLTAPGQKKNPRKSEGSLDGHGWFRTSDLSRVKRALSR
jgi:integrase